MESSQDHLLRSSSSNLINQQSKRIFSYIICTFLAIFNLSQTILNFYFIQTTQMAVGAVLSVLIGYIGTILVFMTLLFGSLRRFLFYWIFFDVLWIVIGLVSAYRQYMLIYAEEKDLIYISICAMGWITCIGMIVIKKIYFKSSIA